MANRFIELVDSGRIADAAALKRAFRAAAKRIHPDLAANADTLHDADMEAAGRAFISLRADYEAALDYLGSPRAPGSKAPPRTASRNARTAGAGRSEARDYGKVVPWLFSRGALYEALQDLIGRGFPRRPRASFPGLAYDESRERVLGYIAGRDLVRPEDRAMQAFIDFEAGYASLARPGSGWLSVENDPARSIYFLLSDILLFHENGFPHLAAFARNVRPTTEALLRERGEARPLAFIAILVADLDAGPACLED